MLRPRGFCEMSQARLECEKSMLPKTFSDGVTARLTLAGASLPPALEESILTRPKRLMRQSAPSFPSSTSWAAVLNLCPVTLTVTGRCSSRTSSSLSENFGRQVEPGTNGDIDGDGEVQFSDFVILSENFGRVAAPAAPVANSNVDAVFAASDDGEDDSFFDFLGL